MGISNNSNNVIYNNEWGFLIIVTTSFSIMNGFLIIVTMSFILMNGNF